MDARRPLKTRGKSWAQAAARFLTRLRLSPNAISVSSVFFALAAGVLFYGVGEMGWSRWWLIAAAACIQLRLISNMLDGMVAVEGGLGSVTGDLFNEVPDRIADLLIIVSFGCLAGEFWVMHLAWLAGALAVFTACVRMQGASLTGSHEFCGPMAKPHRMALLTFSALIFSFWPKVVALPETEFFFYSVDIWRLNLIGDLMTFVVAMILGLMIFGEIVTLCRRLSRIVKKLKMKEAA